jgi:WD40 repeat protein
LAATGSGDHTITVWDTETFARRLTMVGHDSWVQRVTFVSDELLVSCGSDGTTRLWNTDDGDCRGMARPRRIYEGLDLRGASGIDAGQRVALRRFGAL